MFVLQWDDCQQQQIRSNKKLEEHACPSSEQMVPDFRTANNYLHHSPGLRNAIAEAASLSSNLVLVGNPAFLLSLSGSTAAKYKHLFSSRLVARKLLLT